MQIFDNICSQRYSEKMRLSRVSRFLFVGQRENPTFELISAKIDKKNNRYRYIVGTFEGSPEKTCV